MSDRVKLNIYDSGKPGRPVILIHGWPLSHAAWEKQVTQLAEGGLRVIAYDRRGFGHSEKPEAGYDYDTLAGDLNNLITGLDLRDVSLVGFSMGGGEVARYIGRFGEELLHSVVFASAVPPYMMRTDDNPDGPLTREAAAEMRQALESDREAFFEQFTKDFFSVDGDLKVSEEDRQKALTLCHQSSQAAALGCMEAFGTTDFRDDLKKVTVPTLVLHGDADEIVPLDGSGQRTHDAIPSSVLDVIPGAPHGCNVSHPDAFNRALLRFLTK